MLCPTDKSKLRCYMTRAEATGRRRYYKCSKCQEIFITEEHFVARKRNKRSKPLEPLTRKHILAKTPTHLKKPVNVSSSFIEEPDEIPERVQLEDLYLHGAVVRVSLVHDSRRN